MAVQHSEIQRMLIGRAATGLDVRLMGVSTPAIHQMVHHLVALGLLEVAPNPRSGRSKLVLMTPEGRTRRREAMELLADLEDELAHRIGRRRVAALRDALERDWGDTGDGSRLLTRYGLSQSG